MMAITAGNASAQKAVSWRTQKCYAYISGNQVWMRFIGAFTNTCNGTITRLRYTVWFEVRGRTYARSTFTKNVRFRPGQRLKVDYQAPNPSRRRAVRCKISYRWWF